MGSEEAELVDFELHAGFDRRREASVERERRRFGHFAEQKRLPRFCELDHVAFERPAIKQQWQIGSVGGHQTERNGNHHWRLVRLSWRWRHDLADIEPQGAISATIV